MDPHVDDELPDFVSGHLSEAEVMRVESHLNECSTCRERADELDSLAEQLAQAPTTSLAQVQKKLAGVGRFEHLIPKVSALFDLGADDVRTLLRNVDDPALWDTELSPGVHVQPVAGGPAVEAEQSFTVLLKIDAGAQFPTHTHGGKEQVLVLEGGYRDISGQEYWRGELDVRETGTTHSFVALPGTSCLCAVRTFPTTGDS